MSEYLCFLVTVLHDYTKFGMGCYLSKCALSIHRDLLPHSLEYPMEPESRKVLHSLLPEHVRSCGPIVGVERIFAVHVAEAEQ